MPSCVFIKTWWSLSKAYCLPGKLFHFQSSGIFKLQKNGWHYEKANVIFGLRTPKNIKKLQKIKIKKNKTKNLLPSDMRACCYSLHSFITNIRLFRKVYYQTLWQVGHPPFYCSEVTTTSWSSKVIALNNVIQYSYCQVVQLLPLTFLSIKHRIGVVPAKSLVRVLFATSFHFILLATLNDPLRLHCCSCVPHASDFRCQLVDIPTAYRICSILSPPWM